MSEETDQRFDVVIYEIKTGLIDRVIGTDMRRSEGHYNAERRVETALSRINDNYNVAIVEAGKFKEGDKLTKADRR